MLAAALAVSPALAQQRAPELSAALITDFVAVTSSFSGATITLFGSTRGTGARQGDVVVMVRGPDKPIKVSRRTPIAGLWIGQERIQFASAPSFLAIATARPLSEILGPTAQERYKLTPRSRISTGNEKSSGPEIERYREALIRIKTQKALYSEDPIGVRLLSGGLFRADIRLPDSTAPGLYTADIMMFRGGRLRGKVTSTLVISKEGLERQTFAFSQEHSAIYALSSIALACALGWLAAAAFRRAGT